MSPSATTAAIVAANSDSDLADRCARASETASAAIDAIVSAIEIAK